MCMELPTLKYEKVANQRLGNLGNIIPNFLMPKFSIFSYSQNRKLGFKKFEKKFLRFLKFLSFQPNQWFFFFFDIDF